MNHKSHSYLMIGLLVLGAALYFSGTGGGALFLIFPLMCMGMMFFMMRGMGGMHGKPDDPSESDRDAHPGSSTHRG